MSIRGVTGNTVVPQADNPCRTSLSTLRGVIPMFEGSLEDPMRFLFGPGEGEMACMALTPGCMGWIPYLASRLGLAS